MTRPRRSRTLHSQSPAHRDWRCRFDSLLDAPAFKPPLRLSQVEKFPPAPHGLDVLKQKLQMPRVVDGVEALAVDDEQRRVLVAVEIAAVRVGKPREVMIGDAALVIDAALVYAIDQRGYRRLQIDHQVGCGCLRLQV